MSNAVSFAGALYVSLDPHDPNGGELPVVANLTTADDSGGFGHVRTSKTGDIKCANRGNYGNWRGRRSRS
jgi:hypothetical protein